jgi:formate C-acetyltransferase
VAAPLCCHYFGGIATTADSLAALNTIVFVQKRHSLASFLTIVGANFGGHDALLQEIRGLPRFGNDIAEVDVWARRAMVVLLDAMEAQRDGRIHYGGAYSLNHHTRFGADLPATPDGRLAGEPVSENQSPVAGTDVTGPTALLKSVATLPFDRAPAGGLNVRITPSASAEQLNALIDAFFGMGGLHLGITRTDRATLMDAQKHPGRYPSLCVRVAGFSEYFTRLSPALQGEIIERTDH